MFVLPAKCPFSGCIYMHPLFLCLSSYSSILHVIYCSSHFIFSCHFSSLIFSVAFNLFSLFCMLILLKFPVLQMCTLQMIKLFYLEISVTEAFLSCQSILQIQGMTRSFVRLLVNKKRILSIKEPAMVFNYIVFSMCTWILSSRKSYMKTVHCFELLPVKLHFITKSCNKKKKNLVYCTSSAVLLGIFLNLLW